MGHEQANGGYGVRKIKASKTLQNNIALLQRHALRTVCRPSNGVCRLSAVHKRCGSPEELNLIFPYLQLSVLLNGETLQPLAAKQQTGFCHVQRSNSIDIQEFSRLALCAVWWAI
jgi:hypothetical protein